MALLSPYSKAAMMAGRFPRERSIASNSSLWASPINHLYSMIQPACATPTAYEIISLGASKAFRSSGVSLLLSFSFLIPSGTAG